MSFPTDAWQNASVNNDDSNTEAPDPGASGRASLEIEMTDAKAFISKKGEAYIAIDMKVLGGPLDTYSWTELRNFKSDGAIKAAKATCYRLGVDVDNCFGIEDIDTQLKQRVGSWYEIEVVQNGEYRNVYVQGPAGRQPAPSDVPSDTSGFVSAAGTGEKAPWDD